MRLLVSSPEVISVNKKEFFFLHNAPIKSCCIPIINALKNKEQFMIFPLQAL